MFRKRRKYVTLYISTADCAGCGVCADKCGHKAIWMKHIEDKSFAWFAVPENCRGCGKCVRSCRQGAIELTEISADTAAAMQ